MILLPSLAVAAPTAGGVTFDCGNAGQPIVGLPGREIHGVFVPATDGSTWETVRWSFGDGTLAEGDAVSHVYDEAGQFTVIVLLQGWAPPEGEEDGSDPWFAEHGLVHVCGEPEPAFDIEALGGLDYSIVNSTAETPYCLTEILWEVFAGGRAEPEMTFDTWEPRITFTDEGGYRIVLTTGGIGGTAAAEQQVDATYGLPQLLRDERSVCATSPGGIAFGLAAAALAVARRRRGSR
jgi:MYXO-CTERM domain-containing protein